MAMPFSDVSIDQVRSFWDRRPCNIRHSPRPVGTREYFDEVEARKYRVEPHIPRFAEFERWRGARVLEIGCGIGTDTIRFARHGAAVTAVDLSARSLEIARERARVYGLADRVRFYEGSAEELSRFVPVEPYDLVYSFGVIHHTPHPDRVAAEMRRFARPGGTVKVMVYHRRSWKVLVIRLRHGRGRGRDLDRLIAEHSEAQTGCPITYVYDREQGRALLERAGFRLIRAEVEHIFPYRVQDYVRYEYVKAWPARLVPGPLFRWLEHRLGWHLCLTAVAPEAAS